MCMQCIACKNWSRIRWMQPKPAVKLGESRFSCTSAMTSKRTPSQCKTSAVAWTTCVAGSCCWLLLLMCRRLRVAAAAAMAAAAAATALLFLLPATAAAPIAVAVAAVSVLLMPTALDPWFCAMLQATLGHAFTYARSHATRGLNMHRLDGKQQVKFVDSVVSRYGVGLKEAAFTVGDGLYVMTKRATDKQVLQRHFVRQDMLRKYEETRNSDGGASAYDQETKNARLASQWTMVTQRFNLTRNTQRSWNWSETRSLA